jgi:LysM repeat protein
MRTSTAVLALAFALPFTAAPKAHAFTHVVKPGETLASIAERVYGRIQYERILVAANDLEVQGGLSIQPGQRLEIPALSYRRVKKGDTWAALAAELLGAPTRSDVLAIANGTNPWMPTDEGAEIVVPYNLRLIITAPDTMQQVAYRYLGDQKKTWQLHIYNGKRPIELARGDVILVPLTDLPLTDEGKKEAAAASGSEATQARGETRTGQKKVASELPALIADVRGGRYVEAVHRGTGFLATADLTNPELAVIHRQLLEAYVALSAMGLASASCDAWRKADPGATLDPNWLSPKILAACQHGQP